jgi:amino acid adenylation domain-containing protein
MFQFQNSPLRPAEFMGVTASELDVAPDISKLDLTLSLRVTTRGLQGWIEYSSDLFDHATIERMVDHFRTLLEGIVANPHERLSKLPLLTEAERHQLLVEYNNTTTNDSLERCVHELVEEQAERTPAAIAVEFDDQRLTYFELNAHVNQLAHYLRGLGVGPEVRVGLCVERSLNLVIGMLGILKAGGAYVPLDPEFPRRRLAYILSDSGTRIVISQNRLLEPLAGVDVQIICLDRDREIIAAQCCEPLDSSVSLRNLCYVIYTSGTTGLPKGVEISHGALANFLRSMSREPGIEATDRLLAVTTVSFDIAALELFLPLVVGARLEIVDRALASDGRRLATRLRQSRPTIMQATPATWRMLLYADADLSMTKVLCGGESLDRETAKRLLARSRELWNLYGPTETTIWSTLTRLETVDGAVPIGRPIANTLVYVFDRYGQLVPIGVSGELHIGGAGLACGYRQQIELTAEKFREHQLPDGSRQRLYATGDQVRWRPDGQLEFLGRQDQQVKIRGYRVELGEVEAVLNQHPDVKDSAVLIRRAASEESSLVAFVVLAGEKSADGDELRAFIHERLPVYMVPARIVRLDCLPTMPNGKVDRRALSQLAEETVPCRACIEPRSNVESKLVEIWSQLLGVGQVGISDDFFELGGESLLAVRLMGRIEREFRRDLPVTTLFENATIEKLAGIIENVPANIPAEIVEIQPHGSSYPLFLVHGMGGDLLYGRQLVKRLAADQSVYGLQSIDDGMARFEDLASRFVAAIRQFQPHGPYQLTGHCYGGLLAYEIARQLRELGCDVGLLAILDTALPPEKRSIKNRAYITLKFFQNLPFRMATVLYFDPPDRLLWRFKERVFVLVRQIAAQLRNDRSKRLRDIVDVDLIRPEDEGKWQRDLRALQDYRPGPYDGRLLLIRAHTRPIFGTLDYDLGWGRLARNALDVRIVPGSHASMLKDPQVSRVAEILAAEMARG